MVQPFSDAVEVNVQLVKSTQDMSRWTMIHEVWKNGDTLSAVITIDGAWINTALRKLAVPPASFQKTFEQMPRVENFELIIKTGIPNK